MTIEAFNKIAEGLQEALQIARGETKPARISFYMPLHWDPRTRELTSPRHALTLPRVQAILFDALWRADGAAVFGRDLVVTCGVKMLNRTRFDELSNKLTPFGLRIASDCSCGYWLEFIKG